MLLIATGGGAGFAPLFPATFGSLVAVALVCVMIPPLGSQPVTLQNLLIVLSLVLIPIGSWAAASAERIFRKKDAGQIVIDEVCGQLLTFVPVVTDLTRPGIRSAGMLILGFVMFRLFDIIKPYPLKALERLGYGWGVMADDVGAGIYAAAVLLFASLLF